MHVHNKLYTGISKAYQYMYEKSMAVFGIELLIQGTCIVVVCWSISNNTQQCTYTVQKLSKALDQKSLAKVLNNAVTLFRHHICSHELRDRLRTVN